MTFTKSIVLSILAPRGSPKKLNIYLMIYIIKFEFDTQF